MRYAQTHPRSLARLLAPLVVAAVSLACTPAGAPASPAASVPMAVPSSPAASVPASAAASPATASGAPTSVTIGTGESSSLGRYLTAPDGRTLYTLSSDPANQSTCSGECATAWPPLMIDPNGTVEPPSGVTGTFGTITRDDGTGQVTFEEHALYEFFMDTAPGQTNGEGVVAFGGTWHVAKAP